MLRLEKLLQEAVQQEVQDENRQKGFKWTKGWMALYLKVHIGSTMFTVSKVTLGKKGESQ